MHQELRRNPVAIRGDKNWVSKAQKGHRDARTQKETSLLEAVFLCSLENASHYLAMLNNNSMNMHMFHSKSPPPLRLYYCPSVPKGKPNFLSPGPCRYKWPSKNQHGTLFYTYVSYSLVIYTALYILSSSHSFRTLSSSQQVSWVFPCLFLLFVMHWSLHDCGSRVIK